MERRYIKVFLLILLYSLIHTEISAQSCISMKYDVNGNRVQMKIGGCDVEEKEFNKEISRNDVQENSFNEDVLVYPNPNSGIFEVRIGSNEGASSSQYEIYNVKGLLVDSGVFSHYSIINIENYTSGLYLIKIISRDKICSKVIVKL